MTNTDAAYQYVLKGIVLVIAVYADVRLKRSRSFFAFFRTRAPVALLPVSRALLFWRGRIHPSPRL
ncbi:hypothetical protein [Aggregatilinea lenta]|uniref:hypothetical protein n=1 Tax=Aggregatilinea lenta TaxID=913108 RepID=UPI000E5C30DC|nr:hypothetical protein [Aggregatilinea lenta]